ncbi:MAG: nitrile hydratase [Acetobacteraceae bacterium]
MTGGGLAPMGPGEVGEMGQAAWAPGGAALAKIPYTSWMDLDTPRAQHDLGGASKYLCQTIETAAHALTDFDKEVDAIRQILGAKKVMSVDELRRGVEQIPEVEYHHLSYYQRWIRSIAGNLLEKGIITEPELAAALEAER